LLLVVLLVFLGTILIIWLNANLAMPLRLIRSVLLDMGNGNYQTLLPQTGREDDIGMLSQSLVNVREQVRQTITDLEGRVAARVRDIQATQEVSRSASTQRDLQKLMDEVVNLILNVFTNIYHAQIFLLDSENQYAVLRASTGDPGRRLLERGHRLMVGSVSVIGQVTAEGRTIIARDTAASGVHRRNEFLPDTRAELAIPLRVGERIIGALDVQSRQDNSFTEDQVNILQIMADQIAISLDNARLYQESIRRLEQIAESSRQQTYNAWEEHMYARRTQAMTAHAGVQTGEDNNLLRVRAIQTGNPAVGERTPRNTIPFAVPIRLRAQVLGAVEWELPIAEYSNEKVLLAEELVSRLAISLDNARLFEQSQRSTDRERIVNSIASRIAGQNSIDDILQTAIREVGQALRVPEVNIRLHSSGSGGSVAPGSLNPASPENGTAAGTNGANGNGHRLDDGHRADDQNNENNLNTGEA
jgi:GAF domain-containing protein